jgi:hypothetical protein
MKKTALVLWPLMLVAVIVQLHATQQPTTGSGPAIAQDLR